MGPFEVAAIALIGAFITRIVTTRMKTNPGTGGSPKIQELEHRIQALEAQRDIQALQERVHVLEEIVTTEDFELQQKFRQLEQQDPESLESESTG
jgi:hypothetical protein